MEMPEEISDENAKMLDTVGLALGRLRKAVRLFTVVLAVNDGDARSAMIFWTEATAKQKRLVQLASGVATEPSDDCWNVVGKMIFDYEFTWNISRSLEEVSGD